MSTPKEKRTKEEAMRLLDRAIEQEESLLEKVKMLENELAACRKKAENPRHELEEQAISKSKVSFRLDFYRTEEKGPLKGIIEHLPTRESCLFEAERFGETGNFIAKFIGTAVLPPTTANKATPTFPPEILENKEALKKEERSPLLRKLFPEIFSTPAPKPLPSQPIEAEPPPFQSDWKPKPFMVLMDGKEGNQIALKKGKPFQIGIRMQTLGDFHGKPCSVSLSAKSMERKPAKTLEALEYCVPDQELLRVPVRTLPLEQGVYRLVVSMMLRDEPQQSYYREARLLIVQ